MNTRASEQLTTVDRMVGEVDASASRSQKGRIARGKQVLAALAATSVFAGCGSETVSSATNNEPEHPNSTSTTSVTGSPSPAPTSGSPSPTSTETAVLGAATNLPTEFSKGPVWYDHRELLGTAAGVVIVADEQEPTEVAGLSAETGEELWSVSTTAAPKGLEEASYDGAFFLGETVVMGWKGTAEGNSLEESDEVVGLAFYEADTGKELATKAIAGSGLGKQLGLNGFLAGGPSKAFTSDGVEEFITYSGDYSEPAPVAIQNSGIIRGPVDSSFTTLSGEHAPDLPGVFEREVDLGVRDDRVLRYLVMEDGAQQYKSYYQVFDTDAMEPVGSAEVCDDSLDGSELAVASPSGEYVAIGQAVVNTETGDVRCLSDLSESLDVTATVLADDGSLYGMAGNDRPFTLESGESAEPQELETDVNMPLAVFDGHALFAADQDGIVAYERP